MLEDIYPWLFQCRHFERSPVLHIFSTLSVKYKASKVLSECYTKIVHITLQPKPNYVVSIILQISVQSGTRTTTIV